MYQFNIVKVLLNDSWTQIDKELNSSLFEMKFNSHQEIQNWFVEMKTPYYMYTVKEVD